MKIVLKQRRVFALHPRPEQTLEVDSYHLLDGLADKHDWSKSPGWFSLFPDQDAKNLPDKIVNVSTIDHRGKCQLQNGHDDRVGQFH